MRSVQYTQLCMSLPLFLSIVLVCLFTLFELSLSKHRLPCISLQRRLTGLLSHGDSTRHIRALLLLFSRCLTRLQQCIHKDPGKTALCYHSFVAECPAAFDPGRFDSVCGFSNCYHHHDHASTVVHTSLLGYKLPASIDALNLRSSFTSHKLIIKLNENI